MLATREYIVGRKYVMTVDMLTVAEYIFGHGIYCQPQKKVISAEYIVGSSMPPILS